MDENPVSHPGVPEDTYHTLGKKTYWIFVLQRVHSAGILLLLSAALIAIKDQSFLKNVGGFNAAPYANLAALIAIVFFIIVFGLTLLIAWLIYANYKFFLGEDSLKIKRGILNKEEVAIPYRQIQNVDISRDLSFQMMGVSKVVILTAGEEESKGGEDDQSEGILPALDKDLAEWLQAELLKRANVQKVVEEK